MNTLLCPAVADVLLMYPGESLKDQIGLWAVRRPERQIETSYERSLPEIRRLLRNADAAMIDGTQDPAQAVDAFLQAVARLGAGAVALYTETSHHGLELFVRLRGSLFLLGPLLDSEWEDVFQRLLWSQQTSPIWRDPPSLEAFAFARRQGASPNGGSALPNSPSRLNRIRRFSGIPGRRKPGGTP